jgi:hypothetical protein
VVVYIYIEEQIQAVSSEEWHVMVVPQHRHEPQKYIFVEADDTDVTTIFRNEQVLPGTDD